jgi:hypothetical protein
MRSADEDDQRRSYFLAYHKGVIRLIMYIVYLQQDNAAFVSGCWCHRSESSLRSRSLLYFAPASLGDTTWWLCGIRLDSIEPMATLKPENRDDSETHSFTIDSMPRVAWKSFTEGRVFVGGWS